MGWGGGVAEQISGVWRGADCEVIPFMSIDEAGEIAGPLDSWAGPRTEHNIDLGRILFLPAPLSLPPSPSPAAHVRLMSYGVRAIE